MESFRAIVLHDTAGNPIGHLGVADDRPMTEHAGAVSILGVFAARAGAELERKRTGDALAESEERLRLFVDHTPAAVAMLDTELRFVQCSARWSSQFEPEQLYGRSLYEVIPTAERWRWAHQRALAGHVERREADPVPLDDGETFWVRWEMRPWRTSDGEIGGVMIFSEDITEKKRAEEELARHRDQLEELVAERTADLEKTHEQLRVADRLAAIGTLAAGLGHDMSNVLLPVRCRLDALDAVELPDEAREQLGAVRRSTDYLQQLSDGLRMMALDPQDSEATTEVTELANWWAGVGSLLANALPQHVEFSTDWPLDLPPVRVSAHRLSQAVLNLVVNAGQAIPRRGLVHLSGRLSTDRRRVHITVADDGRGMTGEVKRRAFDPFFTTRPRGLGSGLGLSLVHGVAQSAGGSVHIESEPGKGTTVVMSLPSEEARGRVRLSAAVSIRDTRIASLASTLLRAADFEVEPVETGPGDCALWLTDAADERAPIARDFLEGGDRRVIVVGEPSSPWAEIDADVVREPADFESMREKIRDVAVALRGAS